MKAPSSMPPVPKFPKLPNFKKKDEKKDEKKAANVEMTADDPVIEEVEFGARGRGADPEVREEGLKNLVVQKERVAEGKKRETD